MDEVPLLLALLILSGFFSGSEIALFSVGAEKIQALKNKTTKKASLQRLEQLEALKAHPSRLLVTILIGNNVVNVAASSIATVIATNTAAEMGMAENMGLVIGVVTGVMTFLILLFGEITPKTLAHRHAVRFSLMITPILTILQFILAPIAIPMSRFVEKFSGTGNSHPLSLNEDELKAAMELAQQEGKIDRSELEWAEKIFEFGEHTVENVMTPRSKLFMLRDDVSVRQALVDIREHKFSRIPVYHEEMKNVVGVLSVHGLIEKSSEPNFEDLRIANLPLKKPYKIPVTMRIDTLLRDFQAEQTHLAVVYDEHGGLVGLITLEDVLEEIFGEIHDEQDEERLEIRRTGKQTFLCSAETELEQLEEFIDEKLGDKIDVKKLPWTLEEENKTIGFFILENLQRFPEVGEVVKIKHRGHVYTFTVKEATEDQILVAEFSIN